MTPRKTSDIYTSLKQPFNLNTLLKISAIILSLTQKAQAQLNNTNTTQLNTTQPPSDTQHPGKPIDVIIVEIIGFSCVIFLAIFGPIYIYFLNKHLNSNNHFEPVVIYHNGEQTIIYDGHHDNQVDHQPAVIHLPAHAAVINPPVNEPAANEEPPTNDRPDTSSESEISQLISPTPELTSASEPVDLEKSIKPQI